MIDVLVMVPGMDGKDEDKIILTCAEVPRIGEKMLFPNHLTYRVREVAWTQVDNTRHYEPVIWLDHP